MMKRRTTQIAGGILILISLFVSSVSACACPHHQKPVPDEKPSCHGHSAEPEQKEQAPEVVGGGKISPSQCCCVQPAPKAITKAEKIKSENDVATTPLPVVEAALHSKTAGESPILERPTFLKDSVCNLTPGRAPPRL